ncbi:MAG: hypothetical protein KME31_03335 [Tolypothrix carrinoi HA7290-LM1]|jgi:hypothetical protein|nr:hypothetical protein [Tolypothrix carrinoi HA7290-LM1]
MLATVGYNSQSSTNGFVVINNTSIELLSGKVAIFFAIRIPCTTKTLKPLNSTLVKKLFLADLSWLIQIAFLNQDTYFMI